MRRYTVLFVFTGHVTSPSLFPKLPFDTVRDFAGITLLATNEAMQQARQYLAAR